MLFINSLGDYFTLIYFIIGLLCIIPVWTYDKRVNKIGYFKFFGVLTVFYLIIFLMIFIILIEIFWF